jgi:(E)-4-hydroxy-3-methylbut-2-enyl-diphosphate synthase
MKSGIALGVLLRQGIGDTLRVSLTDEPEQEVYAARALLEALELRAFGPQIISCPTCGRCEVDLVSLVKKFGAQAAQAGIRKPVKVALMGCMVNGPGEAREADIGVAFGKNSGMLFQHGKPVKKIPYAECTGILLREMKRKRAR